MGLTKEFVYDVNASSEVGIAYSRLIPNTFSVIAQDENGQYIFGREIPCEHGIVEKEFVTKWFRREFWVRKTTFKKWSAKKQYEFGQTVRFKSDLYQCRKLNKNEKPRAKATSDHWLFIPNLKDASVVLSNYPRSTRTIRVSRFRVGCNNGLIEDRVQEAEMICQNFRSNPSPLEEGKSSTNRFIEWYERQELDWTYSDNKKFVAGYSFADPGKEISVSQSAVVFGIVTTDQWKFSTDGTRWNAFDVVKKAILDSKVVAEALKSAAKCSQTFELRMPTEKEKADEQNEHPDYCTKNNYFTFWPLKIARTKWKNPRKVIHLYPEQSGELGHLMDLAIQQALSGPAGSDFEGGSVNSWEGRSVAEFAVHLFKKHLYARFQQIKRASQKNLDGKSLEVGHEEYIFEQFSIDEYRDSERLRLLKDDAKAAINSLNETETFIIENSFGLNGKEVMTPDEISEHFSLDPTELTKIQKGAFGKIKAFID